MVKKHQQQWIAKDASVPQPPERDHVQEDRQAKKGEGKHHHAHHHAQHKGKGKGKGLQKTKTKPMRFQDMEFQASLRKIRDACVKLLKPANVATLDVRNRCMMVDEDGKLTEAIVLRTFASEIEVRAGTQGKVRVAKQEVMDESVVDPACSIFDGSLAQFAEGGEADQVSDLVAVCDAPDSVCSVLDGKLSSALGGEAEQVSDLGALERKARDVEEPPSLTFDTSKFKLHYGNTRSRHVLRSKEAAWDAVRVVLSSYCEKGMVTQEDSEWFLEILQEEVNPSLGGGEEGSKGRKGGGKGRGNSDDQIAAAKILVGCWTCPERCPFVDNEDREWCSLLQECIQQEEDTMLYGIPKAVGPVIQIWATMNAYVVGDRSGLRPEMKAVAWPGRCEGSEGEELNVLHRGGRLHPDWEEWWRRTCQDQTTFRIQRAVATSKKAEVAKKFMAEHSSPRQYNRVYWRFHLEALADPCKHVAWLEAITGAVGEQEFLFPPWCAFTGWSMKWVQEGPGYWEIDVKVVKDNQAVLDDVPTCCWV